MLAGAKVEALVYLMATSFGKATHPRLLYIPPSQNRNRGHPAADLSIAQTFSLAVLRRTMHSQYDCASTRLAGPLP
jgi:hypothetical protein